jgi:hypothetical protein
MSFLFLFFSLLTIIFYTHYASPPPYHHVWARKGPRHEWEARDKAKENDDGQVLFFSSTDYYFGLHYSCRLKVRTTMTPGDKEQQDGEFSPLS